MNEQATMMNQQHQQLMNMNPNMMSMGQLNIRQQPQPQQQMLPINRSYGMWAPPLQTQPLFQNPNPNVGAMKPPTSTFNKLSNHLGPRSNWKGKKINKLNDKRRKEQLKPLLAGSSSGGPVGGVNIINSGVGKLNFNSYSLPTLNEMQHQNRLKTRKYFPKKKFIKNNGMNMNMGYNNNFSNSRSAPYAPRNTTSFLIRAKKSGGIASLVSPCPVTPAVLPTPIFSPSREVLVDMAKEEWGVDGYGSMKGLIRLRSPGHEMESHEDEEEDEGGSSESDVEEHVEVERRLDHDLSRFEMIYNPNSVNVGGMEYNNVLENCVDDQDAHIAQLEEENMILKERLYFMERELGDLTRRLQCLERRGNRDENNEMLENESDNESESREAQSMEENNDEFGEENVHEDGCFEGKDNDNHDANGFEATEFKNKNVLDFDEKVENNERLEEADKNDNTLDAEVKEEKVNKSVDSNKNIEVGEDIEQNNQEKNKCVDEELKAEDCINKNIEVGEDIEQNNQEKNKCVDEELKAEDCIDIELSGRHVCVEKVGVTKDKVISETDLAN